MRYDTINDNNYKVLLESNQLPEIPIEEQTPAVKLLLVFVEKQQQLIDKQFIHIQTLQEHIQTLQNEVARIKKHNARPDIKPSGMDKPDMNSANNNTNTGKRPGSEKKKKQIPIHKTEIIQPDNIPAESRFLGYQDYICQDLLIAACNTHYKLARWRTPDNRYIIGKLPPSVSDKDFGHFGATLVCYILYQYHHQHVTQPLLLEELHSFGVDISSGQLNRIIVEEKEIFHQEKKSLLTAGLQLSNYIQTDDTGARHAGKNGYCTYIGNELFSWFKSTENKSRINFLELLRAGESDYVVNEAALEYMEDQKLPKEQLTLLQIATTSDGRFVDENQWKKHLDSLGITNARHVRIATEGGLLGSVLFHGFPADMVIISDDAGQFNIFNHALCWIHAERGITRLLPLTDKHADDIQETLNQLWTIYSDLKKYKQSPNQTAADEITKRFYSFCHTKTSFASLNQALKRFYKNRDELLLVLKRPDIPLHNNLSERDLRDYVKKRKISGSTRNEQGRRCRDTFASLKKTCKKLEISFWDYLVDRISSANIIPLLYDLIIKKAAGFT